MAEESGRAGLPTPPIVWRGMCWMIISCACFAVMATLARYLSSHIHPLELVFFRTAFQLVFVLPWLCYAGLNRVRTRRLGLHVLRAFGTFGAIACWFVAFALMPIAEAVALSFTAPLFCTLAAGLFLGERVGVRRWVATVVGFGGALIILRPGLEVISVPALLVLMGSALMAVALLPIKTLSRTDSVLAIVFYAALFMLPVSVVPTTLVWSSPPPELWPAIVGLGLAATGGTLALIFTFSAVDASAAMPFDFSRLIFAALLGYVFFGEAPQVWTWIGGAVIFVAALYTTRHEAHAARVPDPPETAIGRG